MILVNNLKNITVLLVFLEFGCFVAAAVTKKPSKGTSTANLQAVISKKLKSATPAQLNKYKSDAAKRLQIDLVKALQALSENNREIPVDVRNSAKAVLKGVKSGKLNNALSKNMPKIMVEASGQPGKPGNQLQTIIGTILPNAPRDLRNQLQNLMEFVSSNLNGGNDLIGKLLIGVPDLLAGVVKNITGTLGGATDALNGSFGSFGKLIGGLLNG